MRQTKRRRRSIRRKQKGGVIPFLPMIATALLGPLIETGAKKIFKTIRGKGLSRAQTRQVISQLKRKQQKGSGILLGPNSPFKNVPLLNLIL